MYSRYLGQPSSPIPHFLYGNAAYSPSFSGYLPDPVETLKNTSPALANFCSITFNFDLIDNQFCSQDQYMNCQHTSRSHTFQCEDDQYVWKIHYDITPNQNIDFKFCCKSAPQDLVYATLIFMANNKNTKKVLHQNGQYYKRGEDYSICSYPCSNIQWSLEFAVKLAYVYKNPKLQDKMDKLQNALVNSKENKDDVWASSVIVLENETGYKANVHQKCLEQSPVLAAMFQNEYFKEGREKTATIPFPSEVIEGMLTFFYTGKLPPLDDINLPQLLYCADKYQIDALKEYTELHLISLLSIENAIGLLRIASECNARSLMEALAHFSMHFHLIGTPSWEAFAEENPFAVNECLKSIVNHIFYF